MSGTTPTLVVYGSFFVPTPSATVPVSVHYICSVPVTDDQVSYSVTTPPAHGALLKDGSPLTAGFTAADVTGGRITYHHTDLAVVHDGFAVLGSVTVPDTPPPPDGGGGDGSGGGGDTGGGGTTPPPPDILATFNDADLYFTPTTGFIDLSNTATRRGFIASNAAPEFLGAHGELPLGLTPAVFLTTNGGSNPWLFPANHGAGGSFAVTRSIHIFGSTATGPAGYFALPRNGAGRNGEATAASANGHVVVGWVSPPWFSGAPLPPGDYDTWNTACYWTDRVGPTLLDISDPVDGTYSFATGVTEDGSVIVGGYGQEAFVWTSASGLVSFGTVAYGDQSRATGISKDGTVIIGWHRPFLGATQACFWDRATLTRHDIGWLSPGVDDLSWPMACNADGSVIVGFSQLNSAENPRAFRWTAATGMVDLGFTPGATMAWASGVSDDGSIVVGSTNASLGSPGFRWTAATGLVATPISTTSVSGGQTMSGDGTVQLGATYLAMSYLRDGTVYTPPVPPLDPANPTVVQVSDPLSLNIDGTVISGRMDASFADTPPPGMTSADLNMIPWVYYIPSRALPCSFRTVMEVTDAEIGEGWSLWISDDGARTWQLVVKDRGVGSLGHYLTRVRWLKLGVTRERVLKLTCSDSIRRNIVGIYQDISPGMG